MPRWPRRDLLPKLSREGLPSCDQPLFYAPPLFPMLLANSHRLFSADMPYLTTTQRQPESAAAGHNVLQEQICIRIVPPAGGLLRIAMTFPWHLPACSILGTPIPHLTMKGVADHHGWFQFQDQRPWYIFLASTPYQVPLYLLRYTAMLLFFFRRNHDLDRILLTICFLAFLLGITYLTVLSYVAVGPEHRYLLLADPLLAILSASMMEQLHR